MIDSNVGPMLVRVPDRTEGGNISKEHDEDFILPITAIKSLSVIGEKEVNDPGQQGASS